MKLVYSLLFLSTPAFAISNEALVKKCFDVGVQKVVAQAQAYGCTVDAKAVHLDDIDNRWWNPSKYVWYSAPAEAACQHPEITRIVQYYGGKCL